jgi:crotonobetainyl-CoA:carnitine CoA-transferase CaiB-like acyl-CoA transferase
VPQLVDDPRFKTNTDRVRNRGELKVELERAFAPYTVDELARILERAAVPCGQVRTVAEAVEDPQVDARQMFFGFDDPELDGFKVLGIPIKLSDHTGIPTRRPPKLGEHTREILHELGYSDTEIERFRQPAVSGGPVA